MFYFSVNNIYIGSIVINLIESSIDVYERGLFCIRNWI